MRASGVLLPISSIPSDYGIGTFSREAFRFVDSLVEAGQSYWQILPMGPTGYGDSPYQAFSTFAGNPYYIDLEELVKKGYLSENDLLQSGLQDDGNYVDYEKQYRVRFPLLRKAYEGSKIGNEKEFQKFVEDNKEWLKDYALFMAIKDSKKGADYFSWEEEIRNRKPDAMEKYGEKYASDVEFYMFLQYEFSRQWTALKKYANEKGIQIIGDIPIYVALDSADTWANPDLFQFDEKGKPKAVAGCPPDAFSATGQLWGNPLYNWSHHKETGYDWWMKRLANCFHWYDVVRIDHFRGFDEYYSIPYGDPTAEHGHWEPGPGIELFQVMKEKLGEQNIIAEDLGFLTDSVRTLLKDSGYPGMKVLQFAFDSREESDYMPHNYSENSVVYTGTHDNQTTYTWWKEMSPEDKDVALRYMNFPGGFLTRKKLTWQLVVMAERSVSKLCIIPAQDFLCLPGTARINTPSTLGYNWQWRMKKGAFTPALCEKIRKMCKLYGRIPKGISID